MNMSNLQLETRNPKLETPSRRGFTLIEILVSIAIIAILASLLVAAGAKMKTSARANQTRTTLQSCMGVADEYEVQTKNKVYADITNSNIDWTAALPCNVVGYGGGPNAVLGTDIVKNSGEQFVYLTWRYETCNKMLRGLGSKVLVDQATPGNAADPANGFYEIRDAWGNKVIYSAPLTGSYLLNCKDPFFVSAGSDGKWGHAYAATISAAELAPFKNPGETDADARTRLATEASDNIYSYNLE